MPKRKKRNADVELLRQVIEFARRPGMTWTGAVDDFARNRLVRDPRTVQRWLSGESPIPDVVSVWLRSE